MIKTLHIIFNRVIYQFSGRQSCNQSKPRYITDFFNSICTEPEFPADTWKLYNYIQSSAYHIADYYFKEEFQG